MWIREIPIWNDKRELSLFLEVGSITMEILCDSQCRKIKTSIVPFPISAFLTEFKITRWSSLANINLVIIITLLIIYINTVAHTILKFYTLLCNFEFLCSLLIALRFLRVYKPISWLFKTIILEIIQAVLLVGKKPSY